MLKLWNDNKPTDRCNWIDLIRGLAVIIMIETHCINVWLRYELMPSWLEYINGLVAPTFIMCAGYSQAISTFNTKNDLRPFKPAAKRIGLIFLCAYLLHAPGLKLDTWPITINQQDFYEFFKIDILQCIAFSLIMLHCLSRLIRKPTYYILLTTTTAITVSLLSPYLWQPQVANGFWIPIRGLINGNIDSRVTSLFPLAPWFAFAAFGAAIGTVYHQLRLYSLNDRTKLSETKILLIIFSIGIVIYIWGKLNIHTWLTNANWRKIEYYRLYNITLPSILQRLGLIFIIGSILGYLYILVHKKINFSIIHFISKRSLFIYILHLKIIFGILLADSIMNYTSWHWHTLKWLSTIIITTLIVIVTVAISLQWQKIYNNPIYNKYIKAIAFTSCSIWIVELCYGLLNC